MDNNPVDAKRRADRARNQQEYDFGDLSGYSDKEISMALRGEQFSVEDYKRLTGKDYVAPGDDDGGGGSGGGGGSSLWQVDVDTLHLHRLSLPAAATDPAWVR